MLVKLHVALLDFDTDKVAYIERTVELPDGLPLGAGFKATGLHPDPDGFALLFHDVCYDHKAGVLDADCGEVALHEVASGGGDGGLDAEVQKWVEFGWVLDETTDLEFEGDDACDDDEDYVDEPVVSDNIAIYDSVVHIYNGPNAKIDVNHD